MNLAQYTAAVRQAHELSQRGAKGVVKYRLNAGVSDVEFLAICNALVMADDVAMRTLRDSDDPMRK
jgi:hypothetical protein